MGGRGGKRWGGRGARALLAAGRRLKHAVVLRAPAAEADVWWLRHSPAYPRNEAFSQPSLQASCVLRLRSPPSSLPIQV